MPFARAGFAQILILDQTAVGMEKGRCERFAQEGGLDNSRWALSIRKFQKRSKRP